MPRMLDARWMSISSWPTHISASVSKVAPCGHQLPVSHYDTPVWAAQKATCGILAVKPAT